MEGEKMIEGAGVLVLLLARSSLPVRVVIAALSVFFPLFLRHLLQLLGRC